MTLSKPPRRKPMKHRPKVVVEGKIPSNSPCARKNHSNKPEGRAFEGHDLRTTRRRLCRRTLNFSNESHDEWGCVSTDLSYSSISHRTLRESPSSGNGKGSSRGSRGPHTCMEALADFSTTWARKKRSKRGRTEAGSSQDGKSISYLSSHINYQEGNAWQKSIVLYKSNVAMVPFDSQLRTKKPRPKVELDEETTRIWNLLLKNINSEGVDGSDEQKAKWWEDERETFRLRTKSFIARMHQILGNRRFSPWKGSVLDSVVGVFLTQSVSDHISSSAFMSMASHYPLKSRSIHDKSPLSGRRPYRPEVFEPNDEEMEWSMEEAIPVARKPRMRLLAEIYSVEDAKMRLLDEIYSEQEEASPVPRMRLLDDIYSKEEINARRTRKVATGWDSLRKQTEANGKRERTPETMDSVDWETVAREDVNEIAKTIIDRGMQNKLAENIKDFLNRIVREHGSIDLEWLRDIEPDQAKEFLLSVRGLGLKSVECVRLLTLHQVAFPVDTNVARIAVRLGWVPLQPLPESLQLHLLELYPVLESIQKYLWPRICKLDQPTLYELHYQLITFGKVFCTKLNPNCNACPMRAECRHFASAYASARLTLPAPEERSIISDSSDESVSITVQPWEGSSQIRPLGPIIHEEHTTPEPIIEEPTTPEPEKLQPIDSDIDIEDVLEHGETEILEIKLNLNELNQALHDYIQTHVQAQDSEMPRALAVVDAKAASLPMPKLKSINQLRTEHQVYEVHDSHPLLQGFERREADDPSPYLLAIWTPGETVDSIKPPESTCSSCFQDSAKLCNQETCFPCNSIRESNSKTVRGTLLIPCRTAMRGSFPLNGTYFQVNEMFADHESSLNPIAVPRDWLWNLPRRKVYFGTSVSNISRGLTQEEIQSCFWKGFVCVRGFDRRNRAPRPLTARLHFPASKLKRARK